MNIDKLLFYINLTKDEDFSSQVVDCEKEDNQYNVIVKKIEEDSLNKDYVKYVVSKNDNVINIRKEYNNDVIDYKLLFKNILGRYFCEVSSNYIKKVMYEFDKDILPVEEVSNSNIIEENIESASGFLCPII